ncbi:MAG: hypothetical protein IH975_06830 [Nitrospinae bacterium]|nr:hypothetical protein [Nitrospinota bacterium]
MSKVYKTPHHPVGSYSMPWFEIKGGKLYPTPGNPECKNNNNSPWFEVRGSEIYPTAHHPQGRQRLPWFEIKGNNIYKTLHHPRYEPSPFFEIRDR